MKGAVALTPFRPPADCGAGDLVKDANGWFTHTVTFAFRAEPQHLLHLTRLFRRTPTPQRSYRVSHTGGWVRHSDRQSSLARAQMGLLFANKHTNLGEIRDTP